MGLFDDEPRRPPPVPHVVGEDLARLSEAELAERIAILQAEIARLEEGLAAKRATRDAASAFFKS